MGIFGLGSKDTDDSSDRKSHGPNSIYDPAFFKELKRCRTLRDALLRSEVVLSDDSRKACSVGELNMLTEALYPKQGRQPTMAEWNELEWRVQTLWESLGPGARKKFVLGESSPAFTIFCVASGFLALLSLIFGIGLHIEPLPLLKIPSEYAYILWLISLGAMGSVAFIGMNALSVQDDATFDLTNGRLVSLRIILGALFGLVLSVSVSFPSFQELLRQFGPTVSGTATKAAEQTMYLLLPFILGFSTPLVIAVLNKFVDAVQTFFGLTNSKADLKSINNEGTPGKIQAPPRRTQPVDPVPPPIGANIHAVEQLKDPKIANSPI